MNVYIQTQCKFCVVGDVAAWKVFMEKRRVVFTFVGVDAKILQNYLCKGKEADGKF